MTKHTCETCRWWARSEPLGEDGRWGQCRHVSQMDTVDADPPTRKASFCCSEHSALQRERERLRIAGEVIAALAPMRDAVRHHVALAYEYADALLAEHERRTQ